MTKKLIPISDLVEVRNLQDLIKPMLGPPAHIGQTWVKHNNWIAVPVESGCHFDDNDAKLLAQAMQSAGFTSCFVVATEPLANFPLCLHVATTNEGLMGFMQEFAHC